MDSEYHRVAPGADRRRCSPDDAILRGAVELDGLVAELQHLGEVVARVHVQHPKGIGAGQKAFAARCSMTTESLPPEKSMIGEANVAATSRMM